jgi:hypothetical protein
MLLMDIEKALAKQRQRSGTQVPLTSNDVKGGKVEQVDVIIAGKLGMGESTFTRAKAVMDSKPSEETNEKGFQPVLPSPEGSIGEVVDKVAKVVGVSGATFERAKRYLCAIWRKGGKPSAQLGGKSGEVGPIGPTSVPNWGRRMEER